MKQILIVNSTAGVVASGSPKDLTVLTKGQIGIWGLGDSAWATSLPKKNFAIALGRGTNTVPFIIPEVDVKSLTIEKATYNAGATWTASLTVPTPIVGQDYTIVLVKKAAVFHERNTWTSTHRATNGQTAANIATILGAYFERMIDSGSLNLKVTVAGAKITFTATEKGPTWEVKGADAMMSVTATDVTEGKPAVGDKAYVEYLASQCAAGKGFDTEYPDGPKVNQGYPEEVEDAQYTIFTLRFAVPRVAAKTRDEVVNQLVHIAVPSGKAAAVQTLLTAAAAAGTN